MPLWKDAASKMWNSYSGPQRDSSATPAWRSAASALRAMVRLSWVKGVRPASVRRASANMVRVGRWRKGSTAAVPRSGTSTMSLFSTLRKP